MIARRKSLEPAERSGRTRALIGHVWAMEVFTPPAVVLSYVGMSGEVDPGGIVDRLSEQGFSIVLPRVVPGEDHTLDLHVYRRGDKLERSALGVAEPLCSATLVEPADVDVVLVPGLAFDLRGNRVGFGKGYYDRLLERMPMALKLGLCFDFQLVDSLSAQPHDVPVDRVVTDRRARVCVSADSAEEVDD